jgi:hypothetical protein
VFTLSIVPSTDETVYIVEDDFAAKLGRVYRETDSAQCDRETTLQDLSTTGKAGKNCSQRRSR